MDAYKMPHESSVEWGLRRRFLEAHADRFSGNQNRLFCLASCFINIEMYGCSYPDEVMAEVHELVEDIADDVETFRSAYRARTDIQFVKEGEPASKSGNYQQRNSDSLHSSKKTLAAPASVSKCKAGGTGLLAGFVKSGDSFSSADTFGVESGQAHASQPRKSASSKGTAVPHPPTKSSSLQGLAPQSLGGAVSTEKANVLASFFKLQGHIKKGQSKPVDTISKLHKAANMVPMKLSCTFDSTGSGFICHLHIDDVRIVSSSIKSQKKISKTEAYEKASPLLMKPHMEIRNGNELCTSDQPFSGCSSQTLVTDGKKKAAMLCPCMARGNRKRRQTFVQNTPSRSNGFYLLQPMNSNQPAYGILHTSSQFSKQPMEWKFCYETVRCTVTLHGEVLADVVEGTTPEAKKAASEMALALLRDRCWTFQAKQAADSDEAGITRTEILGDEGKTQEALPTSNIGNKMMRLMGWGGGGIGKKEQGIAEPISVNTVINRSGLGMMSSQGINKSFLPQIKTTIKDYAISEKEGDLVFAADFGKEERALIHSECRKLNLKSVSRGRGVDRYLVVSRKRTADQLFAMVQAAGGESSKYRLLPPGTVHSSEPLDST